MPGTRRGRGERRLEVALKALTDALTESKAPWMIIGGIAVVARGVRRMTTDVDVVVRGDSISLRELLRHFVSRKIAPRIKDAEQFATANLVLLMRHEPTGVDFDVALGWTDFEQVAIAAATVAKFGAVSAPMARPEDLVVLKAIAARPKDVDDATSLLLMHPGIDLSRVRKEVGRVGALIDDPGLLRGLEAIIASANLVAPAVVRKRPPPRRKPPLVKVRRKRPPRR